MNTPARFVLVLLAWEVAAPALAQRDGCNDVAAAGSEISIAAATEPGARLRVEGTVLASDGTALAGVEVRVFHTDAAGYYSRGGMDEAKARLCGVFRSDAQGRYVVDTVLPGAYATGGGPPPHVHFEVREGGGFFTLNWRPAAAGESATSGTRSRSPRPLVARGDDEFALVYDLPTRLDPQS